MSDFKEWLSRCNANDLMWVIEMANKGVIATEGAGNDPENVFLYDLKCRCEEYLKDHED